MKYPKYPEYKDSGIEWIGEMPEHWKLSRIKFVSEVIMGQSPSSDSYSDDGDIPFLQGCAEFGAVSPDPKHYCDVATKISQPGDILLSVRAPVGEINLTDRVYGIGRGLCSIKPLTAQRDYLRWYIGAAKKKLISISTGSTYDAIAIDDVRNLEIPIPIVEYEQKTIWKFLNTENSKIDSLISKQQKMIELLEEKRQAIITHAVTKGLDPNVPMKDSGIEWIGEIPEDWNVVKIRRKFSVVNGSTPKSDNEDYWDGDICWITPEDLSRENGVVLNDSRRKITQTGYESCGTKLVLKGSIILSTRAPIGYVKIAGKELCTNQGCKTLVKRGTDIDENYVYYYLSCTANILNSMGQGSTFVELSNENLSYYKFPVPPLDAQVQISVFLRDETEKVDCLISKHQQLIELLEEKRQAVITHAVTGKIDVRSLSQEAMGPAGQTP